MGSKFYQRSDFYIISKKLIRWPREASDDTWLWLPRSRARFVAFPALRMVATAFSCVFCSISCVFCSITSVRIVVAAFSFGIYRQRMWLPRSRACSVAFPAMGGLREDQLWLPRSPQSNSFHDSINCSTSKRSHPQSRRVFRSAIAPQ